MIVDKEEAHFLVITPIPDDNTRWLYLLRKTFWIQVAYRVGTTYGQPCFTAKTWRHYIALASLATLCHILRGHIFNFTILIHLLSYLNIHCILHARSTCFVTKSLATCVPFSITTTCSSHVPTSATPSAPPWQAGFVLHILKLALNPNGSTLSLPVQSIHGHHHS